MNSYPQSRLGRAGNARRSRRLVTLFSVEPLESRRLLAGVTFSNTDLNGSWFVGEMGTEGTVQFDGAGNIVGGSFTHDDGSADTPSGTYSLSANGALTINGQNQVITGAMDSSKDVVAISTAQKTNSLGLVVQSPSGTFSDVDLMGNWIGFVNGDSGPPDNPSQGIFNDNSGHGQFSFDGLGNFNGSITADESGTVSNVSGTYTVTANGNVTLQPTGSVGGFAGALNGAKDVLATDAINLPAAATANGSRILDLIRPGAFTDADARGTWTLSTDGGGGTIMLDGAGNLSGSDTNNNGQVESDTGTYNIAADGTVTVVVHSNSPTQSNTSTLTGAMNAEHNVLMLSQPSAGSSNAGNSGLDDLGVLINSVPQQVATTTVLQSSLITLAPSDSETLTATITAAQPDFGTPTGTVTFLDGATVLGSAPVLAVGTASLIVNSLSVGTHSITASYGGDSTFTASDSTANTIIVSVPSKIGSLDPNFGTSGVASHAIGFTATAGQAIQGDGKTVIIGAAGNSPNDVFGITRYNTDGSLDTSFGSSGVVNTAFGSTDDVPSAVMVLSNSDILVAGTATTFVNGVATSSQFALAEYDTNGAPVPGFGTGGQVLASFAASGSAGSNDVANDLAVSSTGLIYLGGNSNAAGTGNDFAIAAFNSDGTPNTTFGGGHVLLDFTGGDDSIKALAVQSDGGVVAAGSTADPGTGIVSVALARFLPTGTLDARFGTAGKITTTVGNLDDQANAVAITAKGQIVVAGFSAAGSAADGTLTSNFLVAQYTSAGKIDPSFGKGPVITSFNQPAAATGVLIDSLGNILVSGRTTASLANFSPDQVDVALARYTSKGVLDPTFNGTGTSIISLSGAGAQPNAIFSSQTFAILPLDTTADLEAKLAELGIKAQGAVILPGGQISIVANSGTNTVQAVAVTSGIDLEATIKSSVPPSVVGGSKGSAAVMVLEGGNQLASDSITIDLSVAPNANGSGASNFQSFPEKISLKQNKGKLFVLKFVFPATISTGDYFLLATIDTGAAQDLNAANNTAASTGAVTIAAPFADLSGSNLSLSPIKAGKPAQAAFSVTDKGNVALKGTISIEFFASPDQTLASAFTLTTVSGVNVNLKNGASKPLHERLTIPSTFAPGNYFLLAVLSSTNPFNDSDLTNDLLVSASPFVAP